MDCLGYSRKARQAADFNFELAETCKKGVVARVESNHEPRFPNHIVRLVD